MFISIIKLICIRAVDELAERARDHREPRREAHERRVRAYRRQEAAQLHGRLQHGVPSTLWPRSRYATATATLTPPTRDLMLAQPTASISRALLAREGHVRLAAAARTHPPMARLQLLVRAHI